jgi:acetoacetyl-CoA synthetase
MSGNILYTPTEKQIEQTAMRSFQRRIEEKYRLSFSSYLDLHRWSIENSETFWTELIGFQGLQVEGELRPALLDKSFESYQWFPRLRLNLAENLLGPRPENTPVVVSLRECGHERVLTYQELLDQTQAMVELLRDHIKEGDCVAAFMPNTQETLICMLATTALGGVFTSTSSDFGIEGVLDRFGQSRPKVLMAALATEYNGKRFCHRAKIASLQKELKSLELLISVDLFDENNPLEGAVSFEEVNQTKGEGVLSFKRMPFNAPAYIMYSSGTTGKPKCIVHTVGGVVLQHAKEHSLHTNLGASDVMMYFTTCGWMMWNWLVSGLMVHTKIVLFEGSPSYSGLEQFMNIINKQGLTVFGTSPKFLKSLQDQNATLPEYPTLKTILSTGAPLLPEQFDFVYQAIKSDVLLASISGGTDILGCFMLGNPTLPVRRGEIQCLGLGMDVAAYNEEGQAVYDLEGELVCRQSFPSRPLCFLDDPEDQKMKEAYFKKYPGVWTHGDFITITKNGAVQVFGRSDATLNPGGVRIGTAEIYRQTEQLDFIEDALCVGRPIDGDVDVVLFVKMKGQLQLLPDHEQLIKKTIRQHTTPRHVPKQVFQVRDIPYTRSGKKMELAVTRLLSGKMLTNLEAIANPECLEEYKTF